MRFTCQTGCTKCCRLRGSVYLTEADLHRAAAYLGLTPAEFESRHVVRYRHVLRLRKLPRGQDHCRFVTAEGCSIHPAKPTQCRTYPFWPSLVESRARWGLESKFCPGIPGDHSCKSIPLGKSRANCHAPFQHCSVFERRFNVVLHVVEGHPVHTVPCREEREGVHTQRGALRLPNLNG